VFLAQTEEDARRLKKIGAAEDRVAVSGNLKFDIRLSGSSELVEQLRWTIGRNSRVIVCGSTAEGEEELLAAAFKKVLQEFSSALMIVAPRHPERFDRVATLLRSAGLEVMRRSSWSKQGQSQPLSGRVFLLDSVGELASVYALAEIAFVGGSLVPLGGHNVLEPAQHGVAIVTGRHTFNFREVVSIFEQGGALRVVEPEHIDEELLQLLRNPAERQRLGMRARELFLENTGASVKTVRALERLLDEAGKR
jgi:3-deoxy-D-manno-octulosonic-acid transferase